MKTDKKIIVAIDGYSGAGKSTIAKYLAKTIGYTYIDSGAMYRAVALFGLENNYIQNRKITNEQALIDAVESLSIDFVTVNQEQHLFLNGVDVESEIRTLRVADVVSQVAAVTEIRRKLVKKQQLFGIEKGIVMDGRDICTAVFPTAELKIFVDASLAIRAGRRLEELRNCGHELTYIEVYENLKSRDYIDTHREEYPLQKTDDSILLDNSLMTVQEQYEWILNEFQKIISTI